MKSCLSPHIIPLTFFGDDKRFLVSKIFLKTLKLTRRVCGMVRIKGQAEARCQKAWLLQKWFFYVSKFFKMTFLKAGAATWKSLLNRLEDIFL